MLEAAAKQGDEHQHQRHHAVSRATASNASGGTRPELDAGSTLQAPLPGSLAPGSVAILNSPTGEWVLDLVITGQGIYHVDQMTNIVPVNWYPPGTEACGHCYCGKSAMREPEDEW